jgi:hypothetical protein
MDGTSDAKVDVDGSLADELEALPRSGDPLGGGIVFPDVAEIGLVGGLGCGEYLLRMALDDIRTKRRYKFVVLQATDQSKTFYERFGFVRVGAVCRYGKQLPGHQPDEMDSYRHWTHANESERSLKKHGGPSYMMCLKLPVSDVISNCSCGRPVDMANEKSLLEEMLTLSVERKPTIEQLGGAATPGPKIARRHSSVVESVGSFTSPKRNKKLARRASDVKASRRKSTGTSLIAPTKTSPSSAVQVPHGIKRIHSNDPTDKVEPPLKRRRIDSASSFANGSKIAWLPQAAVAPLPLKRSYSARSKTSDSAKDRSIPPRRRSASTKLVSSAAAPKEVKKRVFHSIRGPDGKFAPRADMPAPVALKKKAAKSSSIHRDSAKAPPVPPKEGSSSSSLFPKPLGGNAIDRATFRKQKVKSYPRSRVHYYNRVVKKKGAASKEYFFVVEYDEQSSMICIVPMAARGKLSGRNEGRPRYQAVILDTDKNFKKVSASDYQVVPSTMVMKTPILASEAWAIEDD